MGCSSSKKVEEEAAVKTCHDRRSFVKKAIAQRNLLASSHVAYAHSLRRVSLALFYCLAEDEHLYFLQDTAASSAAPCRHRPCSPERKVLVMNWLRPDAGGVGGGAPVHPVVEVEQRWEENDVAAETVTVDGFFGADPGQLFHPSSYAPVNAMPASPPPPQPTTTWDFVSWDPFSSLHHDHQQYVSYGVEDDEERRRRSDDEDDEQMPELEEESDDAADDDDGDGDVKLQAEASPAAVERPMAEEEEEEKTVDRVKNELRVVASEEIEQQSTPGFTVYVDRPPASMAEAMRDIQGHFVKIVDTANHVSVLLEVVPYQRKVRPAAPSDGDDEEGGGEVSPEPFELFKSHKESLDRLYEWEKRLYEEVKAGERVRLSYERKCALLRSQDANGAEPSAIERTRAAMRDLRTKLDISITSVDAVSKRIAAVRDDELLPQLAQLIRGQEQCQSIHRSDLLRCFFLFFLLICLRCFRLARMWMVIADAHRVMKRTADEACALLSSSSAAAARAAAGGEGGVRGPPPPPGQARAATAAGALGAELRGWGAAMEAWAESQRGYAAALWGWARSCVADGEHMPRLLAAWAAAVEAVDVEAATRAVDALAAEAAAVATAARRRGGEEEWNEEEGKKRICVGLAAALAATAEAGGLASAAYGELVVEMEERERAREMAGRDEEQNQN
uniref:Leucine zipper protein-like n=1 Tax=Oryza sativa subsp. japonica TaxID=39947 RepID=Q6H4Z9_ORYSJ|nr:uncharacterized protein LOC107276844 [Oryza sativa Japonica Group]BAD26200.1 leucine zipper protein-like [Oryza sativa Japonica Group]BAD27608.1 leucine zipper protein-like [Oryza sativa Japonica Group]